MKRYVLGFMFSPEKDRVLLIKKNRPELQVGKLNGLGGKIEVKYQLVDSSLTGNQVIDIHEQPKQAMIREFKEESGIYHEDWTQFAELQSENYIIYVYNSIGDIDKAEDMTDEEVFTVEVNKLPLNIMDRLDWLIPMAVKGGNYIIEIL